MHWDYEAREVGKQISQRLATVVVVYATHLLTLAVQCLARGSRRSREAASADLGMAAKKTARTKTWMERKPFMVEE